MARTKKSGAAEIIATRDRRDVAVSAIAGRIESKNRPRVYAL